MSKTLLVFGATGDQGSSVVSYVLQHPQLSKEYKVRAISRDVKSAKAQALGQAGAELAQVDLANLETVAAAARGVDTVFLMTKSNHEAGAEVKEAIPVIDTLVASGVKYIIFSTIQSPIKESNGKYTKIDIFDDKYKMEQYIRSLPIQSAFFAPGTFMRNFASSMAPRPNQDGTYTITNVSRPDGKWPLLDTFGDTGKYVGAILREPAKYDGKVLCGATRMYTCREICEIISKVSGKTVTYECSPEIFEKLMPTEPERAARAREMFEYIDECGHFGADTTERLRWSNEQIAERPTSFEAYLEAHPVI